MPLWIKGLKIERSMGVIVTWSQLTLTFNELDGKLIYLYKNLTDFEDCITDVLLSEIFRCFITATAKGNILVWKYWQTKQLLYNFESHSGAVTSLQSIDSHPDLILSGSVDHTIRIMSLEKYQELYLFKLAPGLSQVRFFSKKVFACIFNNNQIKIGRLNQIAHSFKTSNSKIRQISKCFLNEASQTWNKPSFILQLYQNNSV